MAEELIERIREHNRSADPGWLEGFSASELRAYLERLEWAAEPRGAVWIGQSDRRRARIDLTRAA